MPESSIQRRIFWPFDRIAVSGTGRVFEFPCQPTLGHVQGSALADVCSEGVGVVDVEVAGVDFVEAPCWVVASQGREGRHDPGGNEGVLRGLLGAVVAVVDAQLVGVRVAEEDGCDHMG